MIHNTKRPLPKYLDHREAAKAEAAALKSSGRARVEDLSVFRVKKETKKGKEHEYWHAAWMVERQDAQRVPGELQEAEPRRGAGQGAKDEGGGARDSKK